MKAKPLSYSSPMILAKLAGRKTMTRRIAKFFDVEEAMQFEPCLENGWWKAAHEGYECKCPYGEPGQILRVREAFRLTDVSPATGLATGTYLADGMPFSLPLTGRERGLFAHWTKPFIGKPPMFMFASLSRLYDRLISVRVERLQAISEADVLAEGVRISTYEGRVTMRLTGKFRPADYWPVKTWNELKALPNPGEAMLRAEYASLFESINGPGSWARNPLVWVLTTEPVEKP